MYQSYKLTADAGENQVFELLKTNNPDNSISFTYFVFNNEADNSILLTSLRIQINSSAKIYDLHAYITAKTKLFTKSQAFLKLT